MTGDADRDHDDRAWYETAFGELYPVLYAHRDDESARDEAAFAVERLGLTSRDRVLDLGCGGGRHQRGVARHGVQAIGLDLSAPLLRENRSRGVAALVRADMRRLPFVDGAFDAVLSFFTSFGYFDTEDEDRRVLAEVARTVRPGGRYLFDYLYSPGVRAALVPHSEKEVAGFRMEEARRIEDGCVKKRVRITAVDPADSRELEYEERVRLYDPPELIQMVETAGFKVRATYGGLDGSALGEGSRCVLVAERTP